MLVTGAAGGVGRFAVEMAAGSGATVTGVVADEARAIGLEEIGASAITYELDEIEGPFDFILDAAGGPSFEAAIRLIAPGGDIVVYGNSSDSPAQVSFSDFRGHALARITAFFVYESGAPPTFGEDLQSLADMVAGGRSSPADRARSAVDGGQCRVRGTGQPAGEREGSTAGRVTVPDLSSRALTIRHERFARRCRPEQTEKADRAGLHEGGSTKRDGALWSG